VSVASEESHWRGAKWEVGYEHFTEWVDQHGHALCTTTYVCADGFKLGAWINTQRLWRRNGRLKPEREALLESAGMIWDLKSMSRNTLLDTDGDARTRHEDIIDALRTFIEQHGHADVPVRFRDGMDRPLGNWIREQRARSKSGDIDPELQRELDELGIEWEPHNKTHREMLDALVEYVSRNGHAVVPHQYKTASGLALGAWITNMTSQVRRSGRNDKVVARMLELGVDPWVDSRDARWEAMFEVLVDYRSRFGDVDVPGSFITSDGSRLGQWIGVQRNWKVSGRLRPDREERLSALGLRWSEGMEGPRRHWTDEEVMDALREAATYSFPLSQSAYDRLIEQGLVTGPSQGSKIATRFGSWLEACAAAGVEGSRRPRFTRNEVIDALRAYLSLHTDPSGKDYDHWAKAERRPSLAVVKSRFGSWARAVDEAAS
jgi:hypothetical protein